jgi:hypothetical protein
MTDREMARQLAMGRIGFGVGALVAPGRFNRSWIGAADGSTPGARLLTRVFGVRDAALGLIALRAVDAKDDRTPDILRLCAACDVVDAAATAIAFRSLPKVMRFVVLGMATSAAVIGFRLADRV